MREPEDKALNAPDHGKVTDSQAHPDLGYEASDVNASSVAVFLLSLSVFIVIFFVLCYVTGSVVNNALIKHDGPANKWHQLGAAEHKRGESMASTTEMEQQQLKTMTQRFPSPRLQMDDGDQDLADMHQKEDLLLDHYTWVDKGEGKVRIPIERAMELIVQRGLPVTPSPVPAEGDNAASAVNEAHTVTAPLTNGFARTTYEQDEATEQKVESKQQPGNEVSSMKKHDKPVTTQSGGIQ